MMLLFLEEWWGPLSSTEKVFWSISLIFSVLFLIQFVLSLIGLDFNTDADVDGVHVPSDTGLDTDFTILSVRSIIAFFTFFGWTGVLIIGRGGSIWTVIIFSVLAGIAAMFIVGYMMFQFSKLTEAGNADLKDTLYQTGEVYLSIPANKNGHGKIHIKLQGAIKEFDAVTDGDALPTGSAVKVVEVLDRNLLLVEVADQFTRP